MIDSSHIPIVRRSTSLRNKGPCGTAEGLYVVESRLDLVAYGSSNAAIWCGRIIKSDDRDAITGCRKNRFAAGGAGVRIGRLAYRISMQTGVQRNVRFPFREPTCASRESSLHLGTIPAGAAS